MSAPGWPSVAGTLRAFVDGAEELVRQPGGEEALREVLTSPNPFGALSFLMLKSPSYRAATYRRS